METPVLNLKQQKGTLSAKKSKPKQVIKNALASPFENNYWPLVSPEDDDSFQVVLNNNLPRVKLEKTNIPWKTIKHLPKEERKKFRQNYIETNVKPQPVDAESANLIIGINDVTKSLETNSASCVLIPHDVQPRLMVRHVIDLCVLHTVPLLIVTNLRQRLVQKCGVSSAAIAVKKELNSESKLSLIVETVEELHKKHPFPVDHINYNRSLPCEIQVPVLEKVNKLVEEIEIDEEAIKQTWFLKRDTKKTRVFVPEGEVVENVRCDKMQADSSGFLAFVEQPKPVKKVYKSLVVKRRRGDPNRNKKKINVLKNQRKRQRI